MKKIGRVVRDILGELAAMLVFFVIGAGIMALIGLHHAVESMEPDLLILLGALAVLAAFGVLFAVIAVVRKKKKRDEP